MLTISSGVFVAITTAGAAVKGAKQSGGNGYSFLASFVLNLNFAGIGRFALALALDAKYIKADVKEYYEAFKERYGIREPKQLVGVDSLCLSREQIRMLYSLKREKILYDIEKTKDSLKGKKQEWLNLWEQKINETNTAFAEEYFIKEQDSLYNAINAEITLSNGEEWLYLVGLELLFFVPYFPLEGLDKKELKKLKLQGEYEKEVFQGPLEGYNYYKYREYDLLIWDRIGQTEYWHRDFPVKSLKSTMFISKKGEENILNLSTEEKKHGISSYLEFSEKPKTLQLTAEEVSLYFQSEIRSCHILHRTNCEPDPYFHSNDPIEVKMSSKGTIAAIFSNPKEIAIWNNYKENNYFVLKGDYGHIREIEFSNNGNLLLSVGSDDKVRLWDIEKKECLQIIGTNNNGWDEDDENSLITAKFSNDDKYLILIYRMKYEIWNITEKKYTAHGLHNDPFNINLNIGTDGSIICTELPVKIDPDFDTYCISPNNKLFALISNNILIVYDIAEGKKLSYRECSGTGIGSICFSSDSQYVISTEYSRICVWDIHEEGPVRVIEDKTEMFKDARLCNINNILYTNSNEKIIIWEHKPLEQLLEYLRKIFIN
jgi:WD40 repeat protein